MRITWICRNCDARLAKVTARDDDPRVAALTAQAGDDIIDVDREGNLVVHILCEDCLESIYPEEQSDLYFLRGPELH
ncbi:MAG: anti-sigma-F factor Fin [Bacillota bacterium]|nr:anti-sigma-F factor Fin [Bacillota bacterium]MDW7683052.1 anti-sigma-F factor Fin [Bacillota bacterium]